MCVFLFLNSEDQWPTVPLLVLSVTVTNIVSIFPRLQHIGIVIRPVGDRFGVCCSTACMNVTVTGGWRWFISLETGMAWACICALGMFVSDILGPVVVGVTVITLRDISDDESSTPPTPTTPVSMFILLFILTFLCSPHIPIVAGARVVARGLAYR